MAASKRLMGDNGSDPDHNPKEKRLRQSPSFRSVIFEVMRVKCFHQSLCGVLEPLLRKVVSEEVDRGIRRRLLSLSRSPSLRIKGSTEQEPSNLKLVFSKQFSLPIFTGSKIQDCDKNPIQILLIREQNGQTFQETLPYPIKIELVAIDGDFCPNNGSWSTQEFENNIIKERAGRRPLIAGELFYTMRDGFVSIGDIEFTDNSSWTRGRKFRVGARVVAEASHGVRILQAVSEPFGVRDHRGELYKKHYPPALSDEVWRLEKIGKDGTFHKKLSNNGIKTVQDFLKLFNVDPAALRMILGQSMSEKMWEVTTDHATSCVVDNKVYMLRGEDHILALNSTCQLLWANINGTCINPSQAATISTKARIEELLKIAYENWGRLEEMIEGPTTSTAPQLPGPSHYGDNEAQMVIQRQDLGHSAQQMLDGPSQLGPQFVSRNVEMGYVYFSSDATFENFPNCN